MKTFVKIVTAIMFSPLIVLGGSFFYVILLFWAVLEWAWADSIDIFTKDVLRAAPYGVPIAIVSWGGFAYACHLLECYF